jgi:hypothetical protein
MWALMLACKEKIPESSLDSGQVVLAELPPPAWDADTVTSRTQGFLDKGIPDPKTIMSSFAMFFDQGRGTECPQTGNYTMYESFSGCISESGYRYSGVSVFQPADAEHSSNFLLGDCTITDPEGQIFYCAGEIEYSVGPPMEVRETGTWGHPESPDWLSQVPSMALWIYFADGQLTLNGGYGATWPVGGDLNQLYFDELAITTSCVTGAIELRDPGGGWYRLELPECQTINSVCGSWFYGQEELGSGCLVLESAVGSLVARLEGK